MKCIVQFSGGKDSQATLIWACKKYGTDNVTAVFCDTKWENPVTYDHILGVVETLGVKFVKITSKKYDGMLGLVEKKKRFPSSQARFCTEELKVKPFLDWLLDQSDDVLIHQGIRAKESKSRSEMEKECRYFKYYLDPYYTKKGQEKFLTYRKNEVLEWIKKHDDSLVRPFFEATAQEVIDYIYENGQEPNPLYSKGFKRVGCFPCIMATKSDVKQIMTYYPETLENLINQETKLGTTFFPPDYVPERYRSMSAINKKGEEVRYPTTGDVIRYINDKWATIDMFAPEEPVSCMSAYQNVCE